MDLAERQMWLASGNPCTHPFEPLSFGQLLRKPTSLSGARDAASSRAPGNR
jgi:isopenicillin-N N-acyltransferase like protein